MGSNPTASAIFFLWIHWGFKSKDALIPKLKNEAKLKEARLTENPKITDDVPVIKPKNARHKKVAKQTKFRALSSILLRTLAVVVASALAVGSYAATTITSEIAGNSITLLSTDGKALNEPANFDGPINMLLIGSDTRSGTGDTFGSGSAVLADVIMLLHISADRKNVVAMSFPRDTMVPWPRCPKHLRWSRLPASITWSDQRDHCQWRPWLHRADG